MKRAKQITLGLIGVILVIIGLIGLILPVLPGIILIAIGFILLSLESPRIDRYVTFLASKNKKLEHYFQKTRHWIRLNLGYETN